MGVGFPLCNNYSSTLICDWQICVTNMTSHHSLSSQVEKPEGKKQLGRPKNGWGIILGQGLG